MKYLVPYPLFESFTTPPVTTVVLLRHLATLPTKKVRCDNQEIVDEIITHTLDYLGVTKQSLVRAHPAFFLRHTDTPTVDLEVGFSASGYPMDAYADSVEAAYELLAQEYYEDEHWMAREREFNSQTDYTKSKLYHYASSIHSIRKEDDLRPEHGYPVFDKRHNRYIVSPEFGLSGYLITEECNAFDIVKTHYLDERGEKPNSWHVYKSRCVARDADTYKENVANSDFIWSFLNGEYVGNFNDIVREMVDKNIPH